MISFEWRGAMLELAKILVNILWFQQLGGGGGGIEQLFVSKGEQEHIHKVNWLNSISLYI